MRNFCRKQSPSPAPCSLPGGAQPVRAACTWPRPQNGPVAWPACVPPSAGGVGLGFAPICLARARRNLETVGPRGATRLASANRRPLPPGEPDGRRHRRRLRSRPRTVYSATREPSCREIFVSGGCRADPFAPGASAPPRCTPNRAWAGSVAHGWGCLWWGGTPAAAFPLLHPLPTCPGAACSLPELIKY